MKITIKSSVVLCLLIMPCAYIQNYDIQGFWEFADYKVEIAVSCDCTAEENAMLTEDLYDVIKIKTDYFLVSDYFEFLEGDKIEGTLRGREIEATYTQEGNQIIITSNDDWTEYYELVTIDNNRKLVQHRLGDKENPLEVSSWETSDFGTVELAIISYTITLNELYIFDKY